MFFYRVVALVMLALLSVSVSAGLPMATRPFSSAEDFAQRIETGSGMNATAMEYYRALQEYHPDAARGVSSMGGEYAQNLEIVPCPQGELYRLRAVEKSPRRLSEITRYFKPGEQCFFDRNIGEVVASASCGNVAKAVAAREPARTYEPEPRVEYRDRVVYRDREVPVYVQPEPQYYAPPPQPVVVVEEYGGLDVGPILSSAAIGYGLAHSGDRYYDNSRTHIDNRSNYGNRYWVDNHVDNRQWHNRPPRPNPPSPPPCHNCGGGGGPVNPPSGPPGCPGGNCGGSGNPYNPPGGGYAGYPVNPPTGPYNPPTGYYQ